MSDDSTTERYDWSEVSPSVAVVETVADVDDAEPEALPPLARDVDVDALDELVRDARPATPERVVVSIQYRGCDVALSSTGWLEVEA